MRIQIKSIFDSLDETKVGKAVKGERREKYRVVLLQALKMKRGSS